jgi:hypothetical protein
MCSETKKERLKKILKLYETEKIPLKGKLIHIHFLMNNCDWYSAKYEKDDFWGYVIFNGDTTNAEWGHFSLTQLKALKNVDWIEVTCETEERWQAKT